LPIRWLILADFTIAPIVDVVARNIFIYLGSNVVESKEAKYFITRVVSIVLTLSIAVGFGLHSTVAISTIKLISVFRAIFFFVDIGQRERYFPAQVNPQGN